jgi:ABC-type transporter Mla MlaB component
MQKIERIALSGLLTVGTVSAGKAALLAASERSDVTVIEIAETSPIDVSGVQLIDAARHHATQLKKRVKLAAPATGRILELLQTAGFLDKTDADSRAFWLQGDA